MNHPWCQRTQWSDMETYGTDSPKFQMILALLNYLYDFEKSLNFSHPNFSYL